MIIISGREFRTNQGKYIDLASKGQDVVLKLRGKGSFRLVPVKEDDSIMSEEKFYAKLDHSIKQYEEGEITRQQDEESVESFVERLLCSD